MILPEISADFETCRFRPGMQSPPPVCISTCHDPERGAELFAAEDCEREYRRLIRGAAEKKHRLIFHNGAYDNAVGLAWYRGIVDDLFAAYDADGILDTMLFQRIAIIGKYAPWSDLGLAFVGPFYGVPVEKEAVRTFYGHLYGAPLSAYTEAHVRYAKADAVNTLRIRQRQVKRYGDVVHDVDVALLCRKQFWLQLVRNWGLRTDPKRLVQLREECADHVSALRRIALEATIEIRNKKGELVETPIIAWDPSKRNDDGTKGGFKKNMAALRAFVSAAYDGNPPMTEEARNRKSAKPFVPSVSTSRTTLTESGDFLLEKFAEYGEWSAVENKDLPMLEKGTEYPIHTKFGIADTTRTTSSAPNVQNFRRKEGIRECVIPREGYCFVGVDHGGLELSTLAQVIVWLLGTRRMADKINSGIDLHCDVAQYMRGRSYAETLALYNANDSQVKTDRNCSKVVNFGKPGGMANKTLIHYAKYSYGVDLAELALKQQMAGGAMALANKLGDVWERANPEAKEYLAAVGRYPQAAGGRCLKIPGSTILRRGAPFCAAANSGFQGLGAIVEAEVGYLIAKEMYTGFELAASGGRPGKRSVLAESRQCNFVHDEHIFETPIGLQDDTARRLEVIMNVAPQRKMPDVQLKSEAVAMARWSKNAHTLRALSVGAAGEKVRGPLKIWDEDCACAKCEERRKKAAEAKAKKAAA